MTTKTILKKVYELYKLVNQVIFHLHVCDTFQRQINNDCTMLLTITYLYLYLKPPL